MMHSIRQGLVALTVVASLGLVMPSALGGSVLADFKPDSPHISDPDFIDCDLDGNGSYETHYDLQQKEAPPNLQDTHSNTVIVLRQVDLLYSDYTVVHDPHDPSQSGPAVSFHDPIGYWDPKPRNINPSDPNDQASVGKAQRKGQKQVLCTTAYEYDYAPYKSDIEQGAKLVKAGVWTQNFVQSTACDEDSDTPADATREELPQCVTYHEQDTWQWTVTVSGKPVQAASLKAGSTKDADRSPSSRHTHQRGGKHRH
jgi:hypothetical protein